MANFIYTNEVYNTSSATEVWPILVNLIDFNSVVDVGCGLGDWLAVALAQNPSIEVMGIDNEAYDEKLHKINEDHYRQVNLQNPEPLNQKFDLALSLEVAEHLPPESADQFISYLCSLSDVVVFSAAIPGQGGQNHLNEQWPEYWRELFEKNGFQAYDCLRAVIWENEKILPWYRQNMIIYAANAYDIPLPSTSRLLPMVHPAFYQSSLHKIRELEKVKRQAVFNPTIGFALKTLMKSMLITPWRKPI